MASLTRVSYYVNAPGISADKGCVWGTLTQAIGNWSPYVAGANTMATGETFVKIAWNPEYLSVPLAKTLPTYGIKIECPGGGCNGLPCSIDPSKGGLNGLDSPVATDGVGGAAFCVVTVPKGGSANIVVFNTDGSTGGGDEPKPSSKTPEAPKPTSSAKPTTAPSTTVAATPTASSSVRSSAASSTTSEAFYGGIFHEQDVEGDTSSYSTPSPTPQPVESSTPDPVQAVSPTSSNEGAAAEGGSAIAGLVVALVAAAALF